MDFYWGDRRIGKFGGCLSGMLQSFIKKECQKELEEHSRSDDDDCCLSTLCFHLFFISFQLDKAVRTPLLQTGGRYLGGLGEKRFHQVIQCTQEGAENWNRKVGTCLLRCGWSVIGTLRWSAEVLLLTVFPHPVPYFKIFFSFPWKKKKEKEKPDMQKKKKINGKRA